MRALANPILVDGARLPGRHAPKLGADSEAVLAEAGFSAAEIAGFRAEGAI
jgi:crotonobetainyl-CoA:carnitine CoA-transferase CaiB-like acyl-CoA transferase